MTEEEIQLLIAMDSAVWDSYMPYLAAQMQQQIALGVFTGLTAEQIISNIESAALSAAQVETLVTTSLNNYSRSVTRSMMDEEPDNTLYHYIGPIDGRTRDICLEFASAGELTQSQIIKLTGGAESLSFGGGYNCRHKWQSVSRIKMSKSFYDPEKAKDLLSGNN